MTTNKRAAVLMVFISLGLLGGCAERERSFTLKVESPERLDAIRVLENSDSIGTTDSTGSFQLELKRKTGASLVFSYEKDGYKFAPDTVKVPEQKGGSIELTAQVTESEYKKVNLNFSTLPAGVPGIEVNADNRLLGRTDSNGNLDLTLVLRIGTTTVFGYYQDSVALEGQDTLVADPYVQEAFFKVEITESPRINILVGWFGGGSVPDAIVSVTGEGIDFSGKTDSRGEVVYSDRKVTLGSSYRVTVSASGITRDTTLLVVGQATRAALYLRKPLSLGVTFQWDDGTPATAKTIVLESGAFRLEKTANAQGKAVFTHLSIKPGNTYQVYVRGDETKSSLTVLDRGGDFGPFAIPKPISIRLIFLDDETGAPLPGSTVTLYALDKAVWQENRTTDKTGQVEFTDSRIKSSTTYKVRFKRDNLEQEFGVSVSPSQKVFEKIFRMVAPGEIVLTFRWEDNKEPLRSTDVVLTGGLSEIQKTDANGIAVFRDIKIQAGQTYHCELKSGLSKFVRDITLTSKRYADIILLPRLFRISIHSPEPTADLKIFDHLGHLKGQGIGKLELDLNTGNYRVVGKGAYEVARAFTVDGRNNDVVIRTDKTAYLLGQEAFSRGNYDEAREYWSTVEETDEKFSAAVSGLIKCLETQDKTAEALSTYRLYFDKYTLIRNSPEHQFDFALINFKDGKFNEARDLFRRVDFRRFANAKTQNWYECYVQYYISLCYWENYIAKRDQIQKGQQRLAELERIEREMITFQDLGDKYKDRGLELKQIQEHLDQVQAEINNNL